MQIELTEKDLEKVAAFEKAQSDWCGTDCADIDADRAAKQTFLGAAGSVAIMLSLKVALHREPENA